MAIPTVIMRNRVQAAATLVSLACLRGLGLPGTALADDLTFTT